MTARSVSVTTKTASRVKSIPFDIMAYTIVWQYVCEPQVAICRVEGEQMGKQLWTFVRV